jgi:hypothetical protein
MNNLSLEKFANLNRYSIRFEVLTAVNISFWDMTPFSLVHNTKEPATSIFKKAEPYQTTKCHIP